MLCAIFEGPIRTYADAHTHTHAHAHTELLDEMFARGLSPSTHTLIVHTHTDMHTHAHTHARTHTHTQYADE